MYLSHAYFLLLYKRQFTLMTRDQLSSLLHHDQSQSLERERPKASKQPWNAFQNSDFVLNRSFPLQTFGGFHSLLIPQLDLIGHSEARFDADSESQRPYLTFLEDQSPLCGMPYLRGWSESMEYKKVEEPLESQGFEVNFQSIHEKGDVSSEQHRQSNSEINTCTPNCKQELKSFSNISQNTVPSARQKMQLSHSKGYLSKNVTKNIGKLLIKYIWKNRNKLMQRLGVSPATWGLFMTMVQEWKKENNITREFLITRWSGTSEEHRIFRILSRFFFRKECRIAILESNIREKSIHIERIIKFDQAITEPKSLDYLS